jgi:hypothetical protein
MPVTAAPGAAARSVLEEVLQAVFEEVPWALEPEHREGTTPANGSSAVTPAPLNDAARLETAPPAGPTPPPAPDVAGGPSSACAGADPRRRQIQALDAFLSAIVAARER